MLYFYLVIGGGIAAITHAYLVWLHRGKGKYSISEHAVADGRSHLIYFIAHVPALRYGTGKEVFHQALLLALNGKYPNLYR